MPWVPGGDPYQPQDFIYDNWSQHLAPAFQQALAGLYSRGLDVNAPEQVVDLAYPRAGSAQLRQGHEQELMRALQMFRAGQEPGRPDMVTPPPYWVDESTMPGGASNTGTGALGDPGSANVTGPNAALGMTGLGVALAGAGFPGLPGVAGQVVSNLGSVMNAGRTLGGNNVLGNQTMTALDPEGNPINVAALRTGFFDSLLASMRGQPTLAFTNNPDLASFVAQNPNMVNDPESMNALTAQGLKFGNVASEGVGRGLGFTEGGPHPAFGFAGFNAPSQNPSPYGQTPSIQARGDESNSPPAGPPAGPPAEDDGGMGGVGSGPAGPAGGVGNSGSPGEGVGAAGGGPAGLKKGGIIKDTHKGFARRKGTEVVPIKAHEGEFVVNRDATRAARPQLEALNRMIPDGASKREGLDELVKRAGKFFDVG